MCICNKIPIASRNQNLKVFPGFRIIEGNLKFEFKKILPFWLQKCPMHSLQEHTYNKCQILQISANQIYLILLNVFNLTLSVQIYKITWDIQSLKIIIIITCKAVKK